MSGRHAMRSTSPSALRKIAQLTAVAVLTAGTVTTFGPGAGAGHEPANKTSASGSRLVHSAPNQEVVILSEKVKTSAPTDLILSVTAECAITTALATVGEDTATARGYIEVWVEIDGKRVPVSQDAPIAPATGPDNGEITFCDRVDTRSTNLSPATDSIETFQNTKSANGFNWMALNVGSAIHLIEVKARLTVSAGDGATAEATIGGRTLIVEPTKSANDEVVTTIG